MAFCITNILIDAGQLADIYESSLFRIFSRNAA